MSASSKARRLIGWDRLLMLVFQEDELCGSPFGNLLCQRRWGHRVGLHAYESDTTAALWKLPS